MNYKVIGSLPSCGSVNVASVTISCPRALPLPKSPPEKTWPSPAAKLPSESRAHCRTETVPPELEKHVIMQSVPLTVWVTSLVSVVRV